MKFKFAGIRVGIAVGLILLLLTGNSGLVMAGPVAGGRSGNTNMLLQTDTLLQQEKESIINNIEGSKFSNDQSVPLSKSGTESGIEKNPLATGPNLVSNGNFESNPYYSWTVGSSGSASFYWDTSVVHGGARSIKIIGDHTSAGAYQMVTIQPGKVYSFSTWVKGENVTVDDDHRFGAVVDVVQADKNGNILPGTEYAILNDGTFDWYHASCDFVADADATKVVIYLMMSGSGTVWFDDVSLAENGSLPVPAMPGLLADTGPDRSTFIGLSVKLDGSKSIGNELTYNWQMTSKPAASLSQINGNNMAIANFIPDMKGDYFLTLTVSNGAGLSDQKQVLIRAKEFADTTDDLCYGLINKTSKNYLQGYRFMDMIPLADGWVIIGETVMNKVMIINAITGEIGKEYALNAAPADIDFDFENGIVIATQTNVSEIVKINVATGEINSIPTSGIDKALTLCEGSVAFSFCNNHFDDGKINIIDLEEQQVIGTPALNQGYIGHMAYDRVHNNLLLGVHGISPSSLYRYTFGESSRQLTYAEYIRNPGSNGQDIAISNDGNHLAFCCGGGNSGMQNVGSYTIYDYDPSNLTNIYGVWNTDAYPAAAAFSLDNQYLLATDCMENIKLFDVDTHSLIRTFKLWWGAGIHKVGISRGIKILYGLTAVNQSTGSTNLYFYKTEGDTTNCSTPTITEVSATQNSPHEAGSVVRLKASAEGSLELLYSFSVFNGNDWIGSRPYCMSSTFDWTPDGMGYYTIAVQVKDKYSGKTYDDYKLFHYFVSPYFGLNLLRTGEDQISLSWNAVSGADSYNVYRAEDEDNNYVQVGTTMIPYFTDSNLNQESTYFYRISAFLPGWGEVLSDPLSMIKDLSATPGDGQVELTFTAPYGASSVSLMQKIRNGPYFPNTLVSLNAGSSGSTVTDLVNGTPYTFQLVVVGGPFAGVSNEVTVTPTANPEYVYYDVTGGQIIFDTSSGTVIGFTGYPATVSVPERIINIDVTSIGDSAFKYCDSLTSISIPASVTAIGDLAFDFCPSLTAITVDAGNTAFTSIDGILFSKDMKRLIKYPGGITGDYTIPDGVTTINDAFSGCSSLTDIKIPKSVINIGDFAFNNSISLKSVTIANGVKSIGFRAFFGCKDLTGINIPQSVTSIDDEAFYLCSSLSAAYFYGDEPSMGEGVFDSTNSDFTVYYLEEKSGFSNPWYGYPTSVFVDPDEPNIISQPSDLSVMLGDTASISIVAASTGTLSFQWYRNTCSSNGDGTVIEGETGSTFYIPTDTAGTFYYYCIVTNTTADNTVTKSSRAAKIIVMNNAIIQFSSDYYATSEEDVNVSIVINRSGNLNNTVSVEYSTNNGTAVQVKDYTVTSGTLTFDPDETNKTIIIPLTNDSIYEPDEVFYLNLSNPGSGAEFGENSLAAITIEENDYMESTGTVVFLNLEAGFYGIIDDGGQKYRPVNQSGNVQAGDRVSFKWAAVEGAVGFQMWGKAIRLLELEVIEQLNPLQIKKQTRPDIPSPVIRPLPGIKPSPVIEPSPVVDPSPVVKPLPVIPNDLVWVFPGRPRTI